MTSIEAGASREKAPVYRQRFNRSEITDIEYAQMQEAQESGLIRMRPAGPFLFLEFLAIEDPHKLPVELVHITGAKNAERIKREGLFPEKRRVYMQSPDLRVEPENVSLHRQEQTLVCVRVDTKQLLDKEKKIILDPESVHGYVGEFMHSFVVYGGIAPEDLRVEKIPN